MNPFRFSLERVLDWRRVQLETEELRFRQLAAALADLDRARREVLEAGVHAEKEVRSLPVLSGEDLAHLQEFRSYVSQRAAQIAARRAEAEKTLAVQQAAMLEARRRYRLLERLKERRWTEWKAANDKELEELAGESYAAQWARRRAL